MKEKLEKFKQQEKLNRWNYFYIIIPMLYLQNYLTFSDITCM